MATPKCYTMTMDERKSRVKELVELFNREKAKYTSKAFKEAEARLNFIDPFLECLGWDVKNEECKTESFKNVKVETNQIQGQNVKHPDYALRIGAGQTILYVEAKQPSINLKDDPEPALQVRRYGYTSKLNLSLLTDFEELCVYDTTIKTKPTDKVSTARIEYYTYDQYVEKFEELYEKYSYQACNSGKMTFFAENSKNKKGTTGIDDDILQMIEEWRMDLANDIALHNDTIDEYDLTGVVQKIIDRIIFLRICEDKSVEDYGSLKGVLDASRAENCHSRAGENLSPIYSRLKSLFNSANEKFNAGLFVKDDFLDSITVSDKTLTKMIKSLYYPECQYEFSVLPVEILGTIYERFLGKIIQFSRKTKNGHNITVIEKPEVQKAGGVYYTPGYIVQYIVEQTIGAKIKGKTPEEISKMRFVDPACGSGSFLVGAYDYLLRYHLDYYVSEKNKAKAEKNGIIYKDAESGAYKLSIAEKRRILVNNIYGVDLDLQATEVSKVSLFLKLLEDEGRSLNNYGQGEMFKTSDLAQEKILPNMSNNIKCGNSLVGTDFVNPTLFESKEEFVKVRPFDWEKEFNCHTERLSPRSTTCDTEYLFAPNGTHEKNGMFDCVIGNPPYMRLQTIIDSHSEVKDYYDKKYKSATQRYDTYVLFLEKGFNLLKEDGLLSFIIPHKFINSDFGIGIRKFIYENRSLNQLLSFGSEMVFENASTYTCVIGLSHDNKEFKYAQINPKDIEEKIPFEKIDIERLSNVERWSLQNNVAADLIEKLKTDRKTLKEICSKIRVGVQSSGDDIYYLKGAFKGDFFEGFSKKIEKNIKIEKELIRPILKGEDVKGYCNLKNKIYCIYPHHEVNGETIPYEENELEKDFPLTYEYLCNFKKELVERKIRYKTNPKYWYSLHCPREISLFEQPKIITPEISLGCNMTFDTENLYHNTKCYSIILNDTSKENYLSILGILNSPVMWFFLVNTGYVLRGGFFTFKTKYLEPFPIPEISPNAQQNLAVLVDQMLQTQSKLQSAASPSDKQFLEQKGAMLDAQINAQVYKLYGLTDQEIAVVEGK